MEQYKKGGPQVAPTIKENRDLTELVKQLERQVEYQDRLIKELNRDLRKLRNDMRTAISAVNIANANNRHNG